jgi:Family of unknown function (DUF6580)
MFSKSSTPRFFVLTGMILVASLVRFIPHPPNFAPITAMALFGGAYFVNKKLAFLVPIAAMLLTDAIIGFHNTMFAVYLSFAVIVLIGIKMLKNKRISNIILAAVVSSVIFFVITNFAVWAVGTMYPHDIAGLVTCYTAAIPFYQYSILSDLFYTAVLFGTFEFVQIRIPVISDAKA